MNKQRQARPSGQSALPQAPTNGLEEMVILLLQASLRGHLMPSERRLIKRFLGAQKRETVEENKKEIRCPACRSVLQSARATRCRLCGVLLSEWERTAKA